MIRILPTLFLAASLSFPVSALAAETNAKPAHDASLAPVTDVPGLPRVLLIGDSISIGYTLPVREALEGKANVHRPPGNCSSTGYTLSKLPEWLGPGKWDVIHFNWGLHDAKLPPEGVRHSPPDVYEKNLRELVQRLQATGAKLIWATTTPVPNGGNIAPNRRFDNIDKYNAIAVRVMGELGVTTNDLNAVIKPHFARVGRPNDVHYTPEGSAILAAEVVRSVATHLPPRAASATDADVVVYGGTSGGVAAAVAAARRGHRVVLIEPGRHVGGLTSGGLGATDIGKKNAIGGISREFYQRVKKHYANPAAWKYGRQEDFRSHQHDPHADVMFYFEPHVAERIYEEMLREAHVDVVCGERLDLEGGVEKNGTDIAAIRMESGRCFRGRVFIDAGYEGDLMAKAGVSYMVGREANSSFGETHNGNQPHRLRRLKVASPHDFRRAVDPYVRPGDPASGLIFGVQDGGPGEVGMGDSRVQAYCYRLCLTNEPENRVPFSRPADYDPAKYELVARYLNSTSMLPDYPTAGDIEHPVLGSNLTRPVPGVIMPNRKSDSNNKDPVGFNLVAGNYEYPDADYATRERIIRDHISWQQGLIWFFASDPRVPEVYRLPMKDWGYPKDEFTDTGHWPHQLYVREARRMHGVLVMTQRHCDGTLPAPDPVGMGGYTMDSHNVRRYVDENGHVRTEGTIGLLVKQAYPIGYDAVTPRREECTNLLVPVCLSATHVAYGSIRMEPVFMILGQSAGIAADHAIAQRTAVQAIDRQKLRDALLAEGQIIDLSKP